MLLEGVVVREEVCGLWGYLPHQRGLIPHLLTDTPRNRGDLVGFLYNFGN